MKYTVIPAHYRQVTSGVIRKGDLKRTIFGGEVRKVSGSIGKDVSSATRSTVWRRKHVAIKPATVEANKKISAVEKNPLLEFSYPVSKEPRMLKTRKVRLISADGKYIVGLEVSDKNRFKKFLANKVSALKVKEFNPASMS